MLIEKFQYEPNGTLDFKIIYKYDQEEKLIEDATYKSDGNYEGKSTYEYDLKGNMIRKIGYNNIDVPLKITERTITYLIPYNYT